MQTECYENLLFSLVSMHHISMQLHRFRMPSSLTSFQSFRGMYRSLTLVSTSNETMMTDNSSPITSDHVEFRLELLKPNKPLPEVAVEEFFTRSRAISQVADLLNKGADEDELKGALRNLPVIFDSLLVSQILKADIPCDVSLAFFQWLKSRYEFQHNTYTYGVMLNNLGRAGQIHQMKLLFEEMKSNGCEISRITLSNVMLWYYKAKDMRYVARHWNLLRREGTQPSTAIYASYIDFLARSRRFTKIAVIFEEMMRRDYLPSSRLYTVFIEHLVNAGKVEDAAKILELMQHMLVFPSRVTYKFIINGFAKTGKVERMLETLEEMREYFHKPAKQFMPAVIALQKAGMVNEAAVLMEEIQPKVVEGAGSIGPRVDENDDDDATDADPVLTVWRCASTSSFLFDICAFTNALHSWNPEVEKVLEHADLDWEAPLVMGILRRMRKMDVLWSFFHWLKDKVGYKHDSSSTAVLLEKILRSKETLQKKDSLVKDLFDGLKKDGMNFSIQLFNSVIRYYVSVGEPEKGRSIFNLIGAFDLEPNRFSYALLIQGFARNLQGKEATVFLQEMQKKGFPLDNTTCAEMINCLGRARKIDQAYALYCKMLDSDLKPGHFVYKALLTVYSNAGDYGMALKLYDDMRQAGITPTQDMYEVVTRILHKTGRHVDAQQLAEGRRLLNFFDGNKKVLQERLLQVLFTFMRGVKAKKISESA